MSSTFVVDGAEMRKTKARKDHLAVRVGDKTMSFVPLQLKQRRKSTIYNTP